MSKQKLFLALFGLLVVAGGLDFLARRGVHEIAPRGETPEDLADPQPAATDWPWWRGSARNGVAVGQAPPEDWSSSDNILWRTPLSGTGHASPCVWGQRVFIAHCDEAAQVQSLLCVDRATGTAHWNVEVDRGGFLEQHVKNSHASATPACDGRQVYVVYAAHSALWVVAIDFEGQRRWLTSAGPYKSGNGYGSSPVMYKAYVIVAGDNKGARLDRLGDTSFLTAIHRQTGEIVWRVKRQNGDSYGTPVVGRIAGRDQLLLGGKNCVASYDPASGRELWTVQWPVERTAGTVAFDDKCVYASATYQETELVCIRADGSGDVSGTHVVWREKKGAADVPSPIVHAGRLYVVGDQGVVTCFDAATGKSLSKRRLGGNFTASPVLVAGRLFAVNEEGAVFVIREGEDCELIGESSLGEGVLATPAICGGQAFVRTSRSLVCIGHKPPSHLTAPPAARPAIEAGPVGAANREPSSEKR